MADGELAAVFKGLAVDAEQAGGKIAESMASVVEQTADIEDGNIARTLATEEENARSFTGLMADQPPAVTSPAGDTATVVSGGATAETALSNQAHARATELQELLPEGARGRVTMGVGIGKDSRGTIRNVIGSSERNGYLRKPVANAIQSTEEVAIGTGTKHAEVRIIEYMNQNSITPITIGAGRPICNQCEPVIDDAGAVPASPLKGAPPRG